MNAVKHPAYLVLPAYLIGLGLTLFCATALPESYGWILAAGLCLTMLTPLSLLHPGILTGEVEMDIIAHLALWGVCLGLGIAFSLCLMPSDIQPSTFLLHGKPLGWLQVGFVVVQQAAYFGIHAFGPAD